MVSPCIAPKSIPFPNRWIGAVEVLLTATFTWPILAMSFAFDFDAANLILSLGIALVFGIALLIIRTHPFRVLGLVPPAMALAFGSYLAGLLGASGVWTSLGYVVGISMIAAASIKYLFRTIWPINLKEPYWYWKRPRIDGWIDCTLFLIVFGHLWWSIQFPASRPYREAYYRIELSLAVSIFLLAYSWIRLFRPFFEVCLEAVYWRNYRITSSGSGASSLPLHGPLIVIANHACWWDPLFLAKVLPRPVTPMMTSIFYDRWFLKPLVKYVFGAIRVEDARLRREAPEIQEAIRALDDGKCLVLFPESFLRRKEDVPLRRFGRGVWEILKARPDTPVVCCWIEGAWGSYCSYWNGPPTKNKVKERRRPISIGMAAPITVPAEKLQQHLATRIYLMNEVSAGRTHLGLPALPPFELPAKDDEPAPEQPA